MAAVIISTFLISFPTILPGSFYVKFPLYSEPLHIAAVETQYSSSSTFSPSCPSQDSVVISELIIYETHLQEFLSSLEDLQGAGGIPEYSGAPCLRRLQPLAWRDGVAAPSGFEGWAGMRRYLATSVWRKAGARTFSPRVKSSF